MKTFVIAIAALCSYSATAFTTTNMMQNKPVTALKAQRNNDDVGKKVALSSIAAALITSAVVSPTAALAFDSYTNANTNTNTNPDFGASTEIIAARSGGRAGGRSSMGARSSYSSRPAAPSRSYSRSSTTVVTPPSTVVRPTVIMGSPFGFSPFGYSPFGGFGMGYGLGAASSIGNEIRDIGQDRQLADERAELAATKEREAQLEQRLRALEQQQQQQQNVAPAAVAPAPVAP